MKDLTEIERMGANARARGESEFSCPYYAESAMPARTGEPLSEWNDRAEAWRRGFLIEDAMR